MSGKHQSGSRDTNNRVVDEQAGDGGQAVFLIPNEPETMDEDDFDKTVSAFSEAHRVAVKSTQEVPDPEPVRVSGPGVDVLEVQEEEDDFDKTVSAFSGVRGAPVKSAQEVPEREPVKMFETGVDVPEAEEDDFDKTVSAFSGVRGAPVKSTKEVPEREPVKMFGTGIDVPEVEDEDDFDKTVSTFSGVHGATVKSTREVPEVEEEDDFDKAVSAFSGVRGAAVKSTKEVPEREPVKMFGTGIDVPEVDEEEVDFDKTVSVFTGARPVSGRVMREAAVPEQVRGGESWAEMNTKQNSAGLSLLLRNLLTVYVVLDISLKLIADMYTGCLAAVFWIIVYVIRSRRLSVHSGVKTGFLILAGIVLTGVSVFRVTVQGVHGISMQTAFMVMVMIMNVISFLLAYLLLRKHPGT